MKRSPLTRRTPLRRRASLSRMSAKAEKIAPVRRAFVARILLERPVCQFLGCANDSYDVHEVITRARGGSILEPDNVKALCRKHHDWIHAHPEDATALGLLAPSWTR